MVHTRWHDGVAVAKARVSLPENASASAAAHAANQAARRQRCTAPPIAKLANLIQAANPGATSPHSSEALCRSTGTQSFGLGHVGVRCLSWGGARSFLFLFPLGSLKAATLPHAPRVVAHGRPGVSRGMVGPACGVCPHTVFMVKRVVEVARGAFAFSAAVRWRIAGRTRGRETAHGIVCVGHVRRLFQSVQLHANVSISIAFSLLRRLRTGACRLLAALCVCFSRAWENV